MKTKSVRRVRSTHPVPQLETVAGHRVKRLLAVFTSLVLLPRAGERNSSRESEPASPAWTRRRRLIPARQWNSLTGKRATSRDAWKRAKLFG